MKIKQEPLINIVIPVYNTEKFLKKCLDSCLSQTYKNINIICVNDGSSDSSLSILNEYKEKYGITIIDQENRGVAAARNAGIQACQDKSLISFVDSDDNIEPNYIEKLIAPMIEEGSDISLFVIKQLKINNANEALKVIIDYNCSLGPYKKILKTDITKDILFNENLHVGEDIMFTFSYFSKAAKFSTVYYDQIYYHHGINENSLTRRKTSQKRIIDTCLPWFYCLQSLIKEQPNNKALIKLYNDKFVKEYLEIVGVYKENKNNYKIDEYKKMKAFAKNSRAVKIFTPANKKERQKKNLYLINPLLLKIVKNIVKR